MHEIELPWYRQFWPWFLIFLPACAVTAGIATVIIASHNPDGVVVDDYYKEGLAINQNLARDLAARKQGLTADASLDVELGVLRVRLLGKSELLPALELQLLHPTMAAHDQQLTLRPNREGSYEAAIPRLTAGNWHLLIEPANHEWRLRGRLQLPDQTQVTLTAD